MMHKSTLEQWLILQTIIDKGGFTAAADSLYKSQSSVSYAIKNLQEQLGAKLIQVEGKKVSLTDIGSALLDDIRPLLAEFTNVERKAKTLISGDPAKISIEVDSLYPKSLLFQALASFEEAYPHTQIELKESIRLFHSNKKPDCDLFIGSRTIRESIDEKLYDVEVNAVAHADHPLFRLKKGELSMNDLTHYTRVYIDNIGEFNNDTLDLPKSRWTVNTVESAIEAVTSKLCFGWLPLHRVDSLLETGVLRCLPLAAGCKRVIPMYLTYTDFEQSTTAVKALARMLKECH
ncbi:LysR family transcriptional regulator [Vibrio salinus]|uniref:LysR family transcriptional regulator n=1 Tax=Vibrio salinus TaxID=2899784 RepID=UPI001E2A051F|nr:LysR family transcriptional regulator [Vibrio salinus]MCE0496156.1 LysR family transcriptional regulator [Vibrio salinus]